MDLFAKKIKKDYADAWHELATRRLHYALDSKLEYTDPDYGTYVDQEVEEVISLHELWFERIKGVSIPNVDIIFIENNVFADDFTLNVSTPNKELIFQFKIWLRKDGIYKIALMIDNFQNIIHMYKQRLNPNKDDSLVA